MFLTSSPSATRKATCAETVLAQHEESKPKEAFIRSTRAQETIIKCRKDAARKKNQEVSWRNLPVKLRAITVKVCGPTRIILHPENEIE